jgi:hypothetical protein
VGSTAIAAMLGSFCGIMMMCYSICFKKVAIVFQPEAPGGSGDVTNYMCIRAAYVLLALAALGSFAVIFVAVSERAPERFARAQPF